MVLQLLGHAVSINQSHDSSHVTPTVHGLHLFATIHRHHYVRWHQQIHSEDVVLSTVVCHHPHSMESSTILILITARIQVPMALDVLFNALLLLLATTQ
jgi:hypothetical protein